MLSGDNFTTLSYHKLNSVQNKVINSSKFLVNHNWISRNPWNCKRRYKIRMAFNNKLISLSDSQILKDLPVSLTLSFALTKIFVRNTTHGPSFIFSLLNHQINTQTTLYLYLYVVKLWMTKTMKSWISTNQTRRKKFTENERESKHIFI